jgi:CheY-like chemotaxis protein
LPLDSFAAAGTMIKDKPSMKVIQQIETDAAENKIDDLINSLRVTNEGIETRNLDLVNEMINETGDDRNSIQPMDKVVLVVEDDFRFGKILIDKAHEKGMKAMLATNYLEVFEFINRVTPIAITLDVKLIDTSGWKIIDLLRNDLIYRHIPIHVISGEENRQLAIKRGARSFLLKPIDNDALNDLFSDIVENGTKEMKNILVVEDNELDSSQIVKILQDKLMDVTIASTGEEALQLTQANSYDCLILDYTLPDMPGAELIQKISKVKKRLTPIIVYSARDFNKSEMNQLNNNSTSVLLKGANSIDQLLEQTVSHLHINHKDLAPEKRRIIENIRNKEDILSHKNILVVDDDVRNLFALTTVFERFNINVITAESGKEAIQLLNENPKIDMVLMDIMMPEMDGYETTQKIRREHKNSTLPIIAVTAKAMKGDRQKCIEAGASDYITKPLKIDQLLSLMRLWFCK